MPACEARPPGGRAFAFPPATAGNEHLRGQERRGPGARSPRRPPRPRRSDRHWPSRQPLARDWPMLRLRLEHGGVRPERLTAMRPVPGSRFFATQDPGGNLPDRNGSPPSRDAQAEGRASTPRARGLVICTVQAQDQAPVGSHLLASQISETTRQNHLSPRHPATVPRNRTTAKMSVIRDDQGCGGIIRNTA